ncbi:MAG TPA: PQQ-binding-like beta-propeller repeat protein, partial [Pyrinomonadaceae bacterium]
MRKSLSSKYILHLFLAIVLMTFLAGVSAQPNPAVMEDWRNEDFGFSARMMTTDRNDNIYVLGDTVVGDYLIIKKFNSAGALLWQTAFDPAERLRGVWIAVDGGNNPVVLASVITGSKADPAGWVTLKYNTNGGLLWSNTLPGPFSDARRVAIDGTNNIYVAGRMWLTSSTGNISIDSVLIKYDANGVRLWTASFDNGNGTAVDEPYSMVISPDNTRIGVAGKSGNLFKALMYDTNGNLLWSKTNSSVYPANDLAFGPGNVSYFATGTYFPMDPNPYQ